MLGIDDDEDVVAFLSRALDETPERFDPNAPPVHTRGHHFDPRIHHPYHGGVTRGVVSQLRRVHTVGGASPSRREMFPSESLSHSHAFLPRTSSGPFHRAPLFSGGQNTAHASLVDRLRWSFDANTGSLRRSRSTPAVRADGGVYASGGDASRAARETARFDATYDQQQEQQQRHVDAQRERAALEQASSARPFGFLGVTRPPWYTRWEAHLDAPGEDGERTSKIFLGAFDAKESAARAHDSAKIKLFGPPPACGELNFPAEEYLDALANVEACDFEEFVRGLVRHGHANERRLSRFRGVHAAPEGKWEARLDDEDA
jgi:hypothetical protein